MQPSEDQTHPTDELLGAQIGSCRLLAVIGQGGMARVYRAHQATLDREVAVKVLSPAYASDADFAERFQWEARATAQLVHPNIITVHDAGIAAGRLYLVMDCLPGNLRNGMRAGLTLDAVGRVVRETAAALTYAHQHGIVHRDVKPANVLLAVDGHAVLSDFGIAKALAETEGPLPVGRGGRAAGTPEYMAPEQYAGGPVDSRSDTYSLGVMLYEMLTGSPPFTGESYTALAHAHLYDPVPSPAQRNPRISPAVQAVILKALDKDPAERFQEADEMALALDQAIAAQQPLRLRPDSYPIDPRVSGPLAAAPVLPRTARTGPPVAPVVLCPQCNARNAGTSRFCVSCGYAFAPGRPVTSRAGASGFVVCPSCGSHNSPSDRFCTACGGALPLASPRRCQDCGARNAAESMFCTACGAALD